MTLLDGRRPVMIRTQATNPALASVGVSIRKHLLQVLAAGLIPFGYVLALSIATLGAQSPQTPSHAIQPQTYEGMVTDTRCGAKHSAAMGMTAADCTRVCVRAGEQFALVQDETVYVLEGEPAALKRVAAQRVKIVGSLTGNKISVASVTPAS